MNINFLLQINFTRSLAAHFLCKHKSFHNNSQPLRKQKLKISLKNSLSSLTPLFGVEMLQ